MRTDTSYSSLLALVTASLAVCTTAIPANKSISGLQPSAMPSTLPATNVTAYSLVRPPIPTLEERQLRKRFNLGFYSSLLVNQGPISATACSPTIPPNQYKAAICSVAVVGELAYTLYNDYKQNEKLRRTTPEAGFALPEFVTLYPSVDGQSNTRTWMFAYTGSPLLVAHDDCYGPGCFEIHYQNHVGDGGVITHQISSRPRLDRSAAQKRDDPLDQSIEDSDDGIYGDYYYRNQDTGAEGGIAQAFNANGFQSDAEAFLDKQEWTNLGAHCFNIFDSDQGTLASTGFVGLSQGSPYMPSDKDALIEQCISDGTGA